MFSATRSERITYTAGSGNVFADLGRPDAAEALLKADLARQISRIIRERELTQTAAAKLLGVDQPKVSALLRGRLSGFSLDRLVRYAAALDQEVRIVVHPRKTQARVAETSERSSYRARKTHTRPARSGG
jgi:predicted XRE-type DNA-binding protein